VGVPEEVRPGPPPRARKGYYLLILALLLGLFALYFYHYHVLIKGSGLVVGEVLTLRAPIKGEVVSVADLGSAFEAGDPLLSLKPYTVFDEVPFLEEKRDTLEASYEELNAERWNLLREKESLQRELAELEKLYRRRLITLPEKLGLLSSLRALEAQILSFEQAMRRIDVELLEIEKRLAQVRQERQPFVVRAAESGFVLERPVSPGTLVFPGDHLLRVSSGPPRYILAYFPLRHASYIHPGQEVRVRLERGLVFRGRIREILKEAAYKPPYILRTFEKRELSLQVLIEIPGLEKTALCLREPAWIRFRRPFLWFH